MSRPRSLPVLFSGKPCCYSPDMKASGVFHYVPVYAHISHNKHYRGTRHTDAMRSQLQAPALSAAWCVSQTFYSIQIPAPLSLPPDLSENNHPPRWKKDKRIQGFPFPSNDRFQKVLYRSDNTPDHHFLPEYSYL